MRNVLLVLLGCVAVLAISCGADGGNSPDASTLRIVSGSENRTLEPLIQQFEDEHDINVEMTYRGSVDIMLDIEKGTANEFDAVWPANSLWITLGDTASVIKHQASIMRSPVVFGVRRSVADRLGWVGHDVAVAEILAAAESGQLRFMMTSATQSNSGASAYLGFLYAFAGGPDVLTSEDLARPEVREQVRRILGSVNRSAGSSGFLADLFVDHYEAFDAMVNYEAVVIETNQRLIQQGREPLYAVYPVDGLAIADSPLGYVNKGDPAKEQAFLQLQDYLLSNETQSKILALGRRVGPLGVNPENVDRSVFNPDWGIDVSRVLNPIKFPPADVIRDALTLYQTALRKPSLTVFCLDFSGSMEGAGAEGVKSAMKILLDPAEAQRYLLQAAPEDITIVVPFNDHVLPTSSAEGDGEEDLRGLLAFVNRLTPDGGTNIYQPVIEAMNLVKDRVYENYSTSIILMTDGRSNEGSLDEVSSAIDRLGTGDVPVYGILFGDADSVQLESLATLTSGRVFDGTTDLVTAFREAKGYN